MLHQILNLNIHVTVLSGV